jgi:intracellular multiplication protein IcmO
LDRSLAFSAITCFSAIFAGQDLPAFQKASKEEAASIGANTNIKIAMKLEDSTETWDFFEKTAGESYVTNTAQVAIMWVALKGIGAAQSDNPKNHASRSQPYNHQEKKKGNSSYFLKKSGCSK